MRVDHFGEIQALFTVLIYVGTLYSALSIIIINITTNTTKSFKQAKIADIEKMALYVLLMASIPWLLASPLLKNFLQMHSVWPIVLLYPVLVLSLLVSARQSFLQGRQDFFGTSIGSLTVASITASL